MFACGQVIRTNMKKFFLYPYNQWRKESDPESDPDPDSLVRGTDLGIRIRIKMSWIPNTSKWLSLECRSGSSFSHQCRSGSSSSSKWWEPRPLVYRPSGASRCPFVTVHGPPQLYFEPLKLLNFDFNADWIQLVPVPLMNRNLLLK